MTSKVLVIWVLQTGEPLYVDAGNPRPMRAMNLADTLIARGHHVVLWSTDFDHFNKRFRGLSDRPIEIAPNLEVRLLPSTGYRRNIGPARLLDHAVLGLELRKRLRGESGSPDVAFIGFPPIETSYVMAKWLKKRDVPALLDIKDQWPVIFVEALPAAIRPIANLLIYPYTWLARKAMRSATGISSMADGFVSWALEYSRRSRGGFDAVFPLTSRVGSSTRDDLEAAGKWWDELGIYADDPANVEFVGSFNSAFDFVPLHDAARAAAAKDLPLRFVLCGDGGELPAVKAMMRGLDNVVFPGWIDRPKIEVLAARSVAAIAPYRNTPNFKLNIPNKIIDSLALGMPILSPLQGEVAALIDDEGVGLRYGDNAEKAGADLLRAIEELIRDETRRQAISSCARELYSVRFSFERVYESLADHLERMAREGQTEAGRSEIG